jgi:iron complex outermembrane receptor protein
LGQVQYKNTGYKNEQSEFLKVLYTFHKFNIYADLQLRNVNYLYEKTLSYELKLPRKDWTFFNWRTGINYELHPNLYLYSFIGQSYKEPTRATLFGAYDDIDSTNVSQIGNFNNVKPESVVDFEFGVNYIDNNKSIKVNYYRMKFTNEIEPIGQLNFIGQPLSKNVDHSIRSGVEVEGWWSVNNTCKLILNTSINTANITHYVTDYDSVTHNNRFPLLTPKFILNAGVEQNIVPGIDLSITEKYISQSWLDNENTQHLPEYIQTNGYISYLHKGTKVLMGMNNIFNRNNYNSGYVDGSQRAFYVAPTRNVYISVKKNF